MSQTIEEKVVSMQFNNSNFEKNVATSMSTLDKLKKSLKFDGAEKGLNNISSAAKNVNMSGLETAVDGIKLKFSAMEVAGVTALANITNTTINAGKRMVKALTIDPITTGFQEYETQINAIQTILANTKSKGSTLDDVNKALDELNLYADQTIYNFTEMTKNIGTFTAAGVDLDKAVTSIKGIANLAAVSGSTSQQASTAMYQLSQALAAGRVSLMDWNSVVNAGMGGELFQNALKRTATQMGYNVDSLIKKYGSFRESLTKGQWLTADVLTETLTQLSGAYTEADLIAQGYTEKQAKEIVELANTAVGAATDVKTFTQLWGTMKESAQSGWAQTWKIIVGDFEEAKELLTGISEFFTGSNGIITKMSNARNNLLSGALDNNPFSKLAARIEKVTAVTEKMTKVTKDYSKIVDKVLMGDFGNGEARVNALTKAGYDWAYIQNLVNERLGDGTRHATNFKESQEELTKTQATTIEQLLEMSDAQLANLGFTKDEIEAFRELEEQSKKTGIPIKDLLKDMDQLNGRTLLINSFKNAGQGLVKVFSSIGTAWRNVFPAMTSEQLYDIIAAVHKFSTSLIMSDENADKLTRTFQGLFSLLHIVSNILGGGLKLGLSVVSKILGKFGLTILDVTAYIGDAATALDDFIFNNELTDKAFDLLADGIVVTAKALKEFLKYAKELPIVQDAIDGLKKGLESFVEVGHYIIDGLQNGLEDGAERIPQFFIDLGKSIIEAISSVLGIHSPSTVMYEKGRNTMEGYLNGAEGFLSNILDFFRNLGSNIVEVAGTIDWGQVFSIGTFIGLFIVLNKFGKAFASFGTGFENLTAPLKGVGDVLTSVSGVIKDSTKKIKKVINSFSKLINAKAFATRAEAVKDLAISLAILAASLYLLSKVDPNGLWNAVAAIAAMSVILAILAKVMDNMTKSSIDITKSGASIDGLRTTLLGTLFGMAMAILAMAAAIKIIGTLDVDSAKDGFIGLIKIMGLMVTFVAVSGLIVAKSKNVTKLGASLFGMAASIAIMAGVVKLLSMMDVSTVDKGLKGVLKFVGVFAAMALITRLASGTNKHLGSTFMGMAVSIGIMAVVVKLLASMDAADMKKGMMAIYQFAGVLTVLAVVTRLASTGKTRLGSTLLSMATSIGIMAGVVKLLGGMNPEDLQRGMDAIKSFAGIVVALTVVSRLGQKDIGSSLLPMAAAVGILAAVAVALSFVDIEHLAKGIIAVGMLSAMMALMIVATRGANDVKGNLIVLTVAIGVLAAAITGLSFIDPKKLLGASAALSMLMGMFGLMSKLSKNVDASFGSLVKMVVIIGILSGIVYGLSLINSDNALANITALSILLLSFSASMRILSSSSNIGKSAMPGLAAMVAVTAGLATILGVMSALNVEASIPSAIALSILLIAISSAMKLIGGVRQVSTTALTALVAMSGVIAILAIIMGAMNALNVEASIPSAIALSLLINALAIACFIAQGINVAAAASGAAGLAAFIGIMAGVIAIAGALAQIPGADWFMKDGIEFLQTIGEGIGRFIGGIIGGIGAGISDSFPDIATNLSLFMENLEGFIEGAKNIDSSVVDAIGSLAGAILIIAAADFIDGVTRFLGLGEGMSGFASQAKALGDGLVAFSDSVSDLDEDSIAKSKIAVGVVKELASAASEIPNSGGLWGLIAGENDMSTFASQFESVGKGITAFVNATSGLNEDAVEKAKAACGVIVELAKAAQEIPNSGGWVGAIVGENDIDVFANKLPVVGTGLTSFANSLTNLPDNALEKVKNAANMIKELATVASEIPNSGGWWGAIAGDNNMDDFGSQMTGLGNGLVSFANSVSTLPDGTVENVATAIDIITQLSNFVNSGVLQGKTGFFESIGNFFGGGGEETETFKTQMVSIGDAISSFSTTISGINIQNVTTAINAIQTISSSLSNMSTIDPNSLSSLSESIKKAIDIINSTVGIDVSGVSRFTQAVNDLAKVNFNGIVSTFSNGQTTLETAGSDLINAVAKGMRSNSPSVNSAAVVVLSSIKNVFKNENSNFNTIGNTLMTEVKRGMDGKEADVKKSAESIASSAAWALRDYYDAFYNAASYLVDGFANGISENTYKARAKAKAMASAADEAARKELDENSPSKVGYKTGNFYGLGFVNGIGNNIKKAFRASSKMANSAQTGLTKAISNVSSIINSDMDAQPTIRPVVDLSDVTNGVNSMNQMFRMQPSVGVLSDLRTIGTSVDSNRRGSDKQLTSAFKELKKTIDNKPSGDTYIVNGVTYDDGSNVSSAVGTLVRAIKIERRS